MRRCSGDRTHPSSYNGQPPEFFLITAGRGLVDDVALGFCGDALDLLLERAVLVLLIARKEAMVAVSARGRPQSTDKLVAKVPVVTTATPEKTAASQVVDRVPKRHLVAPQIHLSIGLVGARVFQVICLALQQVRDQKVLAKCVAVLPE
jgi:hypothetical protein